MHDSDESPDMSNCHTISTMTSLSMHQSHDSSVCEPKCDSTRNYIHLPVCPSSVPSVQPANSMVKIPMGIAGQNFLKVQYLGSFFLSVNHWIHLNRK